MKHRLLLVSAMIAALAAGCGPRPSLTDLPVDHTAPAPSPSFSAAFSAGPAPLAASVRVENRKPDKLAKLIGAETTFGTPMLPGSPNKAFLRSWVNKKNGNVEHQLVAMIAYDGAWRYYNTATDEGGKTLFFVSIEHSSVSCAARCAEMEAFGAIVDDATLRRVAAGGSYDVTFKAKRGNADTVTITSDMAAKQLTAIDSFKANVAMK